MSWKPEFSVGIASIDAQHTKLISLINALHDAMARGEGKDVVGKVLNELVIYTKTHFAYEENLMKKHGYPAFVQHKQLHDKLAAQVLDLETKVREGRSSVTMEVMTFLRSWLQDHILGTDKSYTSFLVGKGVK
ncbi:MAG: bacteriohemerythrin [Ignavibacteriales bacterium]|nr:bacteriohemerythrin [Ignavibacteriales bacterium]